MLSKRVATLAVLTVSVLVAPVPGPALAEGATPTLVAGGGRAAFSGDGGPAAQAGLNRPLGAAVAADGTVYVADSLNHRVRAVAPDGTIRTVVGNDGQTPPRGTLPADAKGTDGTIELRVTPELLGGPIATINSLAVSPSGTLYLADRENSRVVEIPAGAGARPVSTPVPLPTGLAADASGDVWISSASSQLSRLQGGKGGDNRRLARRRLDG